jgi:hypothetical protein
LVRQSAFSGSIRTCDLKIGSRLPLWKLPEFQAMVAEIEADMAAQLTRVREMERNGELEPCSSSGVTR